MSTVAFRRWQDMPEGREKYAAYLASREWAVLKVAVHERSGGICERCHFHPGENVHHKTYIRKYHELTTDLLHVCRPCHEFESGIRNRDPRLDAPATLLMEEIRTVYLAGKVTGTTWRDEIVNGGWSFANHSAVGESLYDGWSHIEDCLGLPCGRKLTLTGPFWRDIRGGHGSINDAVGDHGYGEELEHGDVQVDRESLLYQVRSAIYESDLFFAWIDSTECFGTIAEIGFAHALSLERNMPRVVVVCTPGCPWDDKPEEHWLSLQMANIRVYANSPTEGWHKLWSDPNQHLIL